MNIITLIAFAIAVLAYALVILLIGTLVMKAAFGPLGVALWIVLQIAFSVDLWRKGRTRQQN